jgi:hypothetical protein
MSLSKLSSGNNLIIPARESLVSDNLAGDGKIANLFYSVKTGLEELGNLLYTAVHHQVYLSGLFHLAQNSSENTRTFSILVKIRIQKLFIMNIVD